MITHTNKGLGHIFITEGGGGGDDNCRSDNIW